MKTKTFPLLLPLLLSVIGSSCTYTPSVLVKNQVATRTTNGVQENSWSKKEAKKQISLKKLRVLLVDETTTENETPYQEPFSWRMKADESVKADSVIESIYYNRILLSAFKKHLPQKADVWMTTRKMSPATLDSLIRADQYDAVISARKIRFDYQYFFVGTKAIDVKNDQRVASSANSDLSPVTFFDKPAMIQQNLTFRQPFYTRQPPTQGRTVTYFSEWTLQRILPQGGNEPTTILIAQEGIVTNNTDDYWELLFLTAAQDAGKSIAQVFSW